MVLSKDHVVQRRWSCEVVGSDQSSQADPGLCWGRFAFPIVDLTFHGHWHIFRVRCQPTCSSSFAWLRSHPSLATGKDSTVEVVLATCQQVFFQGVFVIWPIWAHMSTAKGRFVRIRPLIFPARPSKMLLVGRAHVLSLSPQNAIAGS